MTMRSKEMEPGASLVCDHHGCVMIPRITSDDVVSFRKALGLTQEEFANQFDVPLTTLRNWEQKRSQPVISQARLVLYNKLFDEKATLISSIDSATRMEAA